MEKMKKPVWLKMSEEDLKKLIKKLAEKYSPAELGAVLRDSYGIPTTKLYGKKLGAYLKELGLNSNVDLENAEKKLVTLKEHCKNNITDKKAKHKLQKTQGRVNAQRKYSQKKKKI
jgi:small subunit ribosomal protein S15